VVNCSGELQETSGSTLDRRRIAGDRGGERVDEPAYGLGFGNFILVMAAGAQFEVSGLGRHRSGV
jgi:hypothetical protein